MKFATATIGSLAIRVLLHRPELNPSAGHVLRVAHRFDTQLAVGRTTIEERRPARRAMLLAQTSTIRARGADLDDWRKGLAALGPTLVGQPLWIDALPVASWSTRIYEPLQVINFDPVSGAFSLFGSDSLPGAPLYPFYAPLLIGRWDKRPNAQALGGQAAEFEVILTEASPWTCRIGIHAYGSGWTAKPDYNSPPKEQSAYGLEQIALDGVTAREVGLDAINARQQWTQEAQFTFGSRLAVRENLSHFAAMRGSWQSWSGLPAWMQVGAATADTPDTLTARFASDTLTVDYIGGNGGRARVGFVQEISTPARSQAVAGEAYLYRFDYADDPTHPELYTNIDEPLSLAEGWFAPLQIIHQELTRSLKPQNQTATITMQAIAGSYADDWNLARLFAPLTLKIWKCDPDDPETTRGDPIMEGAVTNVLPEGNSLKITIKLLGDLLDAQVPAQTAGERCQTWLTSDLCTKAEADVRSTGTCSPADLSADGMTLTVHGVTGFGGPTYAANWFANGIVRTGSGRATQRATVMTSTMTGGNVVLTLGRAFFADKITAGQAVQIVAGCSGQYTADCGDKFDNQDNFQGEPFTPDYLETWDAGTVKTKK